MTKAELEEYAAGQGVALESGWTKAEIVERLQGDFTTPRITFTAVSGRDQLSEEQKAAIIDQASGTGTADQGSLGGTGGTTVVGGEGGMGTTPAP